MPEWLLIVVLVVLAVLVCVLWYFVWRLHQYAKTLAPWTKEVAELCWKVNWNKLAAAYPVNGGAVPGQPPTYPPA